MRAHQKVNLGSKSEATVILKFAESSAVFCRLRPELRKFQHCRKGQWHHREVGETRTPFVAGA